MLTLKKQGPPQPTHKARTLLSRAPASDRDRHNDGAVAEHRGWAAELRDQADELDRIGQWQAARDRRESADRHDGHAATMAAALRGERP